MLRKINFFSLAHREENIEPDNNFNKLAIHNMVSKNIDCQY